MTDVEPQPGDGPEYHVDHKFWLMRTEKRQEVLEGIRRRNEERKDSGEVGGVREWFEIDYLLRHIDKIEGQKRAALSQVEVLENGGLVPTDYGTVWREPLYPVPKGVREIREILTDGKDN
jgi:hypothetical protein